MNFVGRRKFSHGYEFTHLMVTVVFCCFESTQEIVYDTMANFWHGHFFTGCCCQTTSMRTLRKIFWCHLLTIYCWCLLYWNLFVSELMQVTGTACDLLQWFPVLSKWECRRNNSFHSKMALTWGKSSKHHIKVLITVNISDSPVPWNKVGMYFTAFPTSYLVEQGFNAVDHLLSKQRSRLNITEYADLITC